MASDIDQLVETITRRVEDRLAGRHSHPAAAHTCAGNCAGCGHCVTQNEAQVIDIAQHGASRISSKAGLASSPRSELAGMIDHTLLKADATVDELRVVCEEAKRYHFATVCVNSANIPYVARQLAGSSVKPIAVVGFPLGAATSAAKAFETREAVRTGAREIDMVINLGALKATDYRTVFEDISMVVEAARPYPVKVIIESGALNDEQKVAACTLAKAAGAAFVKTSTGFGPGGATAVDIALMRRTVGNDIGVKASGGVKSTADAEAMRAAGASRIGASASVAIVTGKKSNATY